MGSAGVRHSPVVVTLMIASVIVTVVFAVVVIRATRQASMQFVSLAPRTAVASERPKPGVAARITAGAVTIARTLPCLSFALEPGQALDRALPPGPFEGDFTVTFFSGDVREARLGAEIENGSLIVKRGGEVLLADAQGQGGRNVLTRVPLSFGRGAQQLTFNFKTDGKAATRLRAVWQPIESEVPLPLPSAGSPLLGSDELKGFGLVQQFNCVGCHSSGDAELHAQLHVNLGPNLGAIGARVRPQWLRAWLRDPHSIRHDALMPAIAADKPGRDYQIEDLTHFLVSLGGPMENETREAQPDPDLINTGMVTYHTVGCVACHGPLEPLERLPGGLGGSGSPLFAYVSLGDQAPKTSQNELADFLRDPVAHWPGGRMPSCNLDEFEASSIAAYLIARTAMSKTPNDAEIELDSQRVERGREHFAALGCANCHALGANRSPIESTLASPPLESLANLEAGCLASAAEGGSAPQFSLNELQRQAIRSFLRSLAARRTNDVPLDLLAASIERFNCTACHQYHSERGPESAIARYFVTVEEADLGDEGRLPPNLSDVGAKLNPLWMHQVLTERAAVRPYMGVRMPQFGEQNVAHLPEWFAAAAGTRAEPDHGPTSPSEYAEAGRELVGSKGMNCIQCHEIAGRDATGTPGPDLAGMTERLRYDAFARWVHDPRLTRPGTRMPSFFVAGKSGFTNLLEGDAHKQVEAIWAYLAQGELLPLPEGLVDPGGLVLSVAEEPVVLRTFIKQAGVRAIAVGFPEQLHCAFDSERCRLAAVWTGEFLNAKGAWAQRGGTQTNPSKVAWSADEDQAEQFQLRADDGSVESPIVQFRGYRLDNQRRPIFLYDVRFGAAQISVTEQPLPKREGERASLIRRFTLQGPARATLIMQAPGQRLVSSSVKSNDQGNGTIELPLDSQGKATFDLEVTW